MVLNRKKKGQAVELKCANELKAKGYTILFRAHTCRQGPFFRGHDLAGCIDVVAAHGSSWLMVACASTMSHYAEQRDEIQRFRSRHLLGHPVECEYWVRVKGGWRKFWLGIDGWHEQFPTDGRTAM